MTEWLIQPGDIIVFLIVMAFFIAFRVLDKKDTKMSKARRYIEKQSDQLKMMIDRHKQDMQTIQTGLEEKESSAREMLKRVESLLGDIDSHADDLIELQRQLTHYHKVLKDLSALTDKAEKRLQIVNADIGRIDAAGKYLEQIQKEKQTVQEKLLQTRSIVEREISQAKTTIREELEKVRSELDAYVLEMRREAKELYAAETAPMKTVSETTEEKDSTEKDETAEKSEDRKPPAAADEDRGPDVPSRFEKTADTDSLKTNSSEADDKTREADDKTREAEEGGEPGGKKGKPSGRESQQSYDYESWNAWSRDIANLNRKSTPKEEHEKNTAADTSAVHGGSAVQNKSEPHAFEDLEDEEEEAILDFDDHFDDQYLGSKEMIDDEIPAGRDKKLEEVRTFWKKGSSLSEIAQETGLPRSEIELLIELIRFQEET